MDKYHIRRAILSALVDSEPAPSTPSDILSYPPLRMSIERKATEQDLVMGAVTALVERNYISDLRPGREPLFRITGAGRGQIDREDDLHEFIWGEFASKFS